MGVPFEFTPELWTKVYRRVVKRAMQLTKSKQKALDLVQEAITEALDPERTPWDPAIHKSLADHLCDSVWSLYGNEKKSYLVKNASFSLDDVETASIYEQDPLKLLLNAEEAARGKRLRESLDAYVRTKKDKDVAFLLDDEDDFEEVFPRDAEGNIVRPPNAEAASTRRARAAGYTDAEINNARKRLKRYAIAVMMEDRKKYPR